MEDHKLEMLKQIRGLVSRLNDFDDAKIARLYGEWSQTYHCAGWMMASERGLRSFVGWATTAPCDMAEDA